MPSSLSDSASPPDERDPSDRDPSDRDPSDSSQQRPYHPKRPHRKSRTGCKNCKARKVKCDEVRPTCRSCRLRKTDCLYPDPSTHPVIPRPPPSTLTPTASTISTISPIWPWPSTSPLLTKETWPKDDVSPLTYLISSTPSTTASLAPLNQPPYRPSSVDETDMRLLWFYTTQTCYSFSTASSPSELAMQTRLVQHAFENPFLMDSIFALSSLHLQSLSHSSVRQQIDPSRALAYRARSFEGYRRAVEEAQPKTFPALIANSLLLTALSSQTFREPEGKELYIIDWMVVWRGIGLMIGMMGLPAIQASGLHTLFYRPPVDLDAGASCIPNNLLFMISSISRSDPDYASSQIYYDTLKYLGVLYYELRRGGITPMMNLRIATWFTFLPSAFVELARSKRPRVLVILAYYAMFLKLLNAIWWLRNVGQRSLLDITQHLTRNSQGPLASLSCLYSNILSAPLEAIQIDASDRLALSRHILSEPEWIDGAHGSGDISCAGALPDGKKWVDAMGNGIILGQSHAPKETAQSVSYKS